MPALMHPFLSVLQYHVQHVEGMLEGGRLIHGSGRFSDSKLGNRLICRSPCMRDYTVLVSTRSLYWVNHHSTLFCVFTIYCAIEIVQLVT